MLKTYQGTKIVQAEPMNELVAVENGWCRPNEDNHEWREGYHVVYPDGYNSWSPKNVFEAAYKVADTYLDRMRIEYAELKEKFQRINLFIACNSIFLELSPCEQRLLFKQQMAMYVYQQALLERITYIESAIDPVPNAVPEQGQCCQENCPTKE